MRYEYIILRNFAAIEAVMKTEEIRIDFPQSETGIFLISGPNGSCKTFIQSSLHPFATNGSMDVRSEESLISKGKEGYKELKIVNGSDEYVVKHFYSPSKESHTVKSYIQKNGTELNENGNVRSFKELIELEFGLTLDYMKLVRLGSNVTNFIDLKSTERKAFMGLILDETDLYLQYHKKVTLLLRDCKSVIAHTSNRLAKLNITSVADLQATRSSLQSSLDDARARMQNETSALAVIKHEIDKLPHQTELEDMIHAVDLRIHSIRNDLGSKKIRKLNELPADAPTTPEEIEKALTDWKSGIKVKEGYISAGLERMNSLLSDRSNLEERLERIKKDSDVTELRNIVVILSKEVRSLEDKYKDYKAPCTLDEYREFIGFIRRAGDTMSQMYSFGIDVIRTAIDILRRKADVDSEVSKAISDIRYYKLADEASHVLKEIEKEVAGLNRGAKDKSCKKCPYYEAYDTLLGLTEVPVDKPNHPEEFYQYVKMVAAGMQNVLTQISEQKDLFKKMPLRVQESLALENIFSRIFNLEPLYDLPLLLGEESTISGYENYVDKKATLDSKKRDLSVRESRDDVAYISNQLADTIHKIECLNAELTDYRKDISAYQDEVEFLEEFRSIAEKRKSLEDELKTECANMEEYQKEAAQLKDYLQKQVALAKVVSDLNFYIKDLEDRISDIQYRLLEHEKLTAELNSLKDKYDEIELTREALSSKEGIPMILIKKYLKSVHKITNELLDIAYGGNLRIKPFHITESEFRIPYTVNGRTMSDVTHSSQGETSFITVALSFALMCRRIGKFNIMLLDEIDGPLDKMKRQKFIDVLLHQMDMVGSEQVFIISHNDMFDMYPVSVISTIPVEDKSTSMRHYIEIQKK